jgi:Divergent InlB B-repeat domain
MPLVLVVVVLGLSCLAGTAAALTPSENIPLGSEPSSCSNETSSECEHWTIERLNAARAQLGLPAYELPESFTGLAPDKQLLILTDLDRTAYDYTPVYGLNSNLSEAAQAGVREKRDPTTPATGGPWKGFGSDWASTNALIGYYLWMYDDGYGSPNGDCTSPNAPGCWGHRKVILGEAVTLPQPQLMGAAAGSTPRNAGTALIISANNTTTSYYTWTQAQQEGAGETHKKEEEPPPPPPPTEFSVHVTVSGSGTVKINGTACTASCTQKLVKGAAVKLVASHPKGFKFTGWSGSCTGKKAKCSLVADSEISVTATFAAKPTKGSALFAGAPEEATLAEP